jgi:hypothetical protein
VKSLKVFVLIPEFAFMSHKVLSVVRLWAALRSCSFSFIGINLALTRFICVV